MANYFARKAGNINATDVWATTPGGTAGDYFSSFTSSDVLYSNNFAITVNVSTTVSQVRNDNTNSATAGGSFTLANSVTLTADIFAGSTTLCVRYDGTSGNSANIVGNCVGGAGTGPHAVQNVSTGTLNITGNVTGGNGNNSGAHNNSTGIINITGNATGGTGASGQSWGANNNSTGTINITGNSTGGSGATAHGAVNGSTGILSIIGTVTASQTGNGVYSVNRLAQNILSGPFVTELVNGTSPICCAAWRWNTSPSSSTYLEVATNTLNTKRTLYTADNITGMPDEADVKDGVTYGPVGELTGTFNAVQSPSAADIQAAVWGAATRTITGGTVNTLTNAPIVPSAASIRAEIDSNSTSLSAIKTKTDALNTTRLGQVATTEIVGNLLAQANS